MNRRLSALLALLCTAQLMVILDISAVNVALPDLSRDLSIARESVEWTITSYSLIFGSLLLLGGRAADLLGRRRVFLAGLAIFTASSLASALAGSAGVLFAARAGQGLGAALLSPAALAILTTSFAEGRERTRALAAWGAVGGAGAAIGVLLGGALTELVDWRGIFIVNLPVGVVLAIAAARLVPADAAPPRPRGLDVRGAALATASFGALVYASSQAADAGWTSTRTLGLGVAGLAGLAAFAALELRSTLPLLRVQRLADRAVGGGVLMMLLLSAVMFGTFLLSSIYMQEALGAGPLETGLGFLPIAVVIALAAHAGGHAVRGLGVRVPLAGAFAVIAAGMLLLAGVDRDGSYVADVLPGMLVAGAGLGLAVVCVALAVLSGAEEHEAGMLSGLNTAGHELGGSLGVAVLLTIATSPLDLAGGLGDAYLAAGVLAAGASVLALFVLPPARAFLPRLRLAHSMPVH
jgi:EmrB/QacA subfamily drug resistance transporter